MKSFSDSWPTGEIIPVFVLWLGCGGAGGAIINVTTNLYLKDCLFTLNDDGLTGGTGRSFFRLRK